MTETPIGTEKDLSLAEGGLCKALKSPLPWAFEILKALLFKLQQLGEKEFIQMPHSQRKSTTVTFFTLTLYTFFFSFLEPFTCERELVLETPSY